jgi:tetratricopeptide (TPR) repeat protein
MTIRREDARRWYHRGQYFSDHRDYGKAVVCFDRAIELSPDDPLIWRRRGYALLKLQRYGEAVDSFDRVLGIDPADATAWQRRAYALAHLGRHDEAVACCEKAIVLDPYNLLAWESKGWVLCNLCRYDEAEICFTKVLALAPERESTIHHRDRVEDKQNLQDLDAEIREAERVIEVPGCIRDVVAERDYGNITLARSVLRELVSRAEVPGISRP